MDKLKMQTPDLTDKNIERIASLFPSVITETKDEKGNIKKAVDFDLLKQALSNNLVEGDDERYRLDWPGKKASLLKANMPITKTLRPCREESVNFDTTENLYIEGDNFEVLKILQESYLGKVKMIYIDPPYNTGNDFIYRDDFKKSKEEYEAELGVEDEEGGKLFRNTDSNGRFHSDWLSMMYERLLISRDLLKDDGVIFMSIGDAEAHNLRKICDEVFGEGNVEQYIWNLSDFEESSFTKTASNTVRNEHEYIIACYKSTKKLNRYEEYRFIDRDDFANPDNDCRGGWMSGNISRNGIKSTTGSKYFTIITPKGSKYTRNWTVSKEEYADLLKDNRIYFSKEGEGVPRLKIFKNESSSSIQSTIFTGLKTSITGKNQIKDLFEDKILFDFPKPTKLIKRFIELACGEGDIILDYFSGSATTAHAIMEFNIEKENKHKFIMVQFPELTDEESEAFKAGYKTIAEIGKERIRRAGKKIVEELKAKNQQLELGQDPVDASKLDIGFRVYKTDDSNMKAVFYHPAKLDQKQLAFLESNIKEDRTPEDLLTQVILDLGLELSLPVETKKIGKNTIFIVQTNALAACFDNDIDFKIVDTIAGLKPFKVVFKDASFKDDNDRINVEERFKRLSPGTKVTVI